MTSEQSNQLQAIYDNLGSINLNGLHISELPFNIIPFDTYISPSTKKVLCKDNMFDFTNINSIEIYATRHSSSSSGTLHCSICDKVPSSLDEIQSNDNYFSFSLSGGYLTKPGTPFVIDTTNIKGMKYFILYGVVSGGSYTMQYIFEITFKN